MAVPTIPNFANISDEEFEAVFASFQKEAKKRRARQESLQKLSEALASIRPAIDTYAEAMGKTPAQVFRDCTSIFKALPDCSEA